MILYKDKNFITNSEHPNDDWIGDADYVIDDASELVLKVLEYFPKFKIITSVVKETDDGWNEIEKEVVIDIVKDEEYSEEEIAELKSKKKQELSVACEATIFAGIDVGEYHYSLETSDQANILAWTPLAQAGQSVPYHADGQSCRIFTAEEFMEVSTAAVFFIATQRTYFNLLNQYLTTLTDVDSINSIVYGETPLEGEYLDAYNEIVAALSKSSG